MATESTTTTKKKRVTEKDEVQLRKELDELIASTRSTTRGGVMNILGWCTSAMGCLFVRPTSAGSTAKLTEWGLACLRSLLPVILEHKEGLPPALCLWLQEHVVPSLFVEAGNVEYHDLAFLLVRGLLQQMSSSSSTETAVAVAKRKRRRKA